MRAPISLYGAGYGHLLGDRFLLLEHSGRATGRPRRAVLQVARRLPGDRYVVASGRGTASDWYRNITQEPRVHVSTGRLRRVPAVARQLDGDEARDVLGERGSRLPLVELALDLSG